MRLAVALQRIGHAAVEHGFDHRHATAERVPDHHHIGIEVQLSGAITLHELDAERLQLRAHGRIHIQIRSGDVKSGRLGDGGHTAHEGAGDA